MAKKIIQVHKITTEHYQISGDITFKTAMPILNEIQDIISKSPQNLKIDLTKVAYSSSVSVALLLQIMTLSCKQKVNLNYVNIPQDIIKLAKLSNVATIFTQK